jgi:hypothetical protein
VAIKVHMANHFCIFGDFNSVRKREERRGCIVRGGGVDYMIEHV